MYKILATIHYWGHITLAKNDINEAIETAKKLKKNLEANNEYTFKQIEIVNCETGEMRTYWNNSDLKLKFDA